VPVQLQKNLLRQFFGQAAVAQEVVRQAENHALMGPDNLGEIGNPAFRRCRQAFLHLINRPLLQSKILAANRAFIDILRARIAEGRSF
jgi:hypothetical protein